MKTMIRWPVRAVQLDLARQMETLSFIREFIDFVGQHHYNTIVLYLEARIRTESFPFPDESDSYSKNEIKSIVSYASQRGIDIIPIVATLGHAEQFLRHPQLADIGEIRGDVRGRFNNHPDMFCPSLETTYRFLEDYLTEVASLFPGPFFHIGCDESWDIGFCPLCAEKAAESDGQSRVFSDHLNRMHGIVTRKLGKRMMIWDDLFEMYETALHRIPKDIIMCCWQYDADVNIPRSHFSNREKMDLLVRYEKLGFDCLVCPADYSMANIDTFTEYASTRKTMGGLLTTWEKGTTFLYESFPTIAYAGHLWDSGRIGDTTGVANQVLTDIFGVDDPEFIEALRVYRSLPRETVSSNVMSYLPRQNRNGIKRNVLFRMLRPKLEKQLKRELPGSAGRIASDILLNLEIEALQHRLKDLIPGFFARSFAESRDRLRQELTACLADLESIKAKRHQQWDTFRGNIIPCKTDSRWDAVISGLSELLNQDRVPNLLTLDLFLPEAYSAQTLRILTRRADEDGWDEISSGVFKPARLSATYYTKVLVYANDTLPARMKIESSGYGGHGITFCSLQIGNKTLVPASILNTSGIVEHPQKLLVDDLQWCYMGEKDTKAAFLDPERACEIHSIELSLREKV